MSETSTPAPAPTTAEEIETLIHEFEQYRERLVNDTLTTARKAKLPKSTVMAQLEPELARIDGALEALRQKQSDLTPSAQSDAAEPPSA